MGDVLEVCCRQFKLTCLLNLVFASNRARVCRSDVMALLTFFRNYLLVKGESATVIATGVAEAFLL